MKALALIAMASFFGLGPSDTPLPPLPALGPVSPERFALIAVPHVGEAEGKKNLAYLDVIAVPPKWTVCYGETRGVKRGDYYTDQQCSDMLRTALFQFRPKLHRFFTPTTLNTRLTPQRDTAYVSLAYNAGVHAIGNSTAVRRLNEGDIVGGCDAIGWWNRSGNKVIRGLVLRRAKEVAFCKLGLHP